MVHENSPFFQEEIENTTLDGYWGANAEFIPNPEYLNTQAGLIDMQQQTCLIPPPDIIHAKTDEKLFVCQVMDISGKVVIEQLSNGINSLDISMLNKGTYFVKIFTSDNLYRSTFIKI